MSRRADVALAARRALAVRARTAVEAPGNVALVSAATAWEIAVKYRAGKWPEADILLTQHDDLMNGLGAQPLDISSADAVRAGNLDWDHADPFDRMIAAQSLLHQAALVTRDAAFGDLRGLTGHLVTAWRTRPSPASIRRDLGAGGGRGAVGVEKARRG